MSKPVLGEKWCPTRPPTLLSLVAWLYLDYYQPAGWIWGAVITLVSVFWGTYVFMLFQEDRLEPVWKARKP
jgi:hypothetical protein